MGLFSNDKKPCPVCGEATPRLLATKIADKTPICSKCANKISMESSMIGDLSLEELKEHFNFRDENAAYLAETFNPNKKIEVGLVYLNIDDTNKVFTIPLGLLGNTKNSPVFKFEELKGYKIEVDNNVVETFNRGDSASQITPLPLSYRPGFIAVFDKEENPQPQHCTFSITLYLTNPCWNTIEFDAGSVDAEKAYIQNAITSHLDGLRYFASSLRGIIQDKEKVVETQNNTGSTPEDIAKFKELLDSGAITQEEFDAKKKQLLGL